MKLLIFIILISYHEQPEVRPIVKHVPYFVARG
jgi:hypothetical protein